MASSLAGSSRSAASVAAIPNGASAAPAAVAFLAAEVRSLFGIAATEAAEHDDPAKLVVINAKLHQVIYRATHNQYLLQSLTTIVDTLGLLRHSTFVVSDCNRY